MWKIFFIFLIILFGLVIYAFYDVSKLNNKKYLEENTLYIATYKGQNISIESNEIYEMLSDEQLDWETSFFVTYAESPDDIYIRKDDFYFRTFGDKAIMSYKSNFYGQVRLISKGTFIDNKKRLLKKFDWTNQLPCPTVPMDNPIKK